jgi:hypothetical protein
VRAVVDRVYVGFDSHKEDSSLFSSVAQVVHQLVHTLVEIHPEDRVRGCYHALLLITQEYSFPLASRPEVRVLQNEMLPNPMNQFVNCIVPLAIDRLLTSWLSTDLDAQYEIIALIGLLCRGATHHSMPFFDTILRHLLRMVHMMSSIMQSKPVAVTKEGRAQSSTASLVSNMRSNEPLGYFANSEQCLKIYQKLQAAYANSLSTFSMDKFTQVRQACLEALAVIIKCGGKSMSSYIEETLTYVSSFYEPQPKVCSSESGLTL